MRKIALGAVAALLLSAFPIAATATSAAAAANPNETQLHVINALGNTDTDVDKTTTGPDMHVTVSCANEGGQTIPVVDPNGLDASDGSFTFTLPDGTEDCTIRATGESRTDVPGGGHVETDLDCSLHTGFSSASFYKIVIEPIFTTLENTVAATFPIALTDCTLHKWQDDTSILPNGFARFTVRLAACETGQNFHITSVEANNTTVLGAINSCNDATIELPEGVYDFVIHAQVDPNGDGDFNDEWTAFSPNPSGNNNGDSNDPSTCDAQLGNANSVGAPSANTIPDWNPDNCPTIDESEDHPIALNNISLAHGQAFVFNFVDNDNGHFVPFLTGGDDFDSEIDTQIPLPGPSVAQCDDLIIPLGGPVPGPALLAGVQGANACLGGGLGVIAGPATVQVQFVPNQLPTSDAALKAFCDDIINKFQSTVKAETDYLATLGVSNHTDTTLEALVNDTDALIQEILTNAPLEIRPQVVILTNGLQQLNEGLRAASFNTHTIGGANLKLIQDGLANPPANPEVDAATTVLTAFIIGNCFPVAPPAPGPEAPAAAAVLAAARFTG